MRNRIKRKLHSRKGFTLAEALLAVLILLLVSAIVARGIPVARTAYERVVLSSNAEVLLSTTISTLRNELGTAKNVKKVEPAVEETGIATGTLLTYFNPTRGSSSRIYVASGDKPVIMFQRYDSTEGLSKKYDAVPLISEKTATEGMSVTYAKVTVSGGIVTFWGLAVKNPSGTRSLAEREKLSIRVISDKSE